MHFPKIGFRGAAPKADASPSPEAVIHLAYALRECVRAADALPKLGGSYRILSSEAVGKQVRMKLDVGVSDPAALDNVLSAIQWRCAQVVDSPVRVSVELQINQTPPGADPQPLSSLHQEWELSPYPRNTAEAVTNKLLTAERAVSDGSLSKWTTLKFGEQDVEFRLRFAEPWGDGSDKVDVKLQARGGDIDGTPNDSMKKQIEEAARERFGYANGDLTFSWWRYGPPIDPQAMLKQTADVFDSSPVFSGGSGRITLGGD